MVVKQAIMLVLVRKQPNDNFKKLHVYIIMLLFRHAGIMPGNNDGAEELSIIPKF